MSLENLNDQKSVEQELALEQARIEKMKLELELEKMRQSTQILEPANIGESKPAEKEKWSERTNTFVFFTLFFPPLAIYFMCKWPQFKRADNGTRSRAIAIVLTKITASIFVILASLFWWGLLYTLFFATFDLFG